MGTAACGSDGDAAGGDQSGGVGGSGSATGGAAGTGATAGSGGTGGSNIGGAGGTGGSNIGGAGGTGGSNIGGAGGGGVGGGGVGGGGVGGSGGTGGVPSPCATPTFAPPGGSYTSAQAVVLSTTTPGATIYYTTDGTNPTVASTVYSSPVAVVSDTTLRALCTAPGHSESAIGVAIFDIIVGWEVVLPTPNPAGGTQFNDFHMSLTTTMLGATLCYTLDGSTPTCAGGGCQAPTKTYDPLTKIRIDGQVTNPATGEVTVAAVSCKAGMKDGLMPPQKYTLQVAAPELAGPGPGTWDFDGKSPILKPVLSSVTQGAVSARWTGAPSAPPSCTSGNWVTGNLPVIWPIDSTQGSQSWSFVGCKAGYKSSAIYTAPYAIELGPPSYSASGGTHAAAPAISISNAANAGALGTWTCTTSDGTTPACGATTNACGGTGSSATTIVVLTNGTALQSRACGLAFAPSDVIPSDPFTLKLDPPKFAPPTGTPVDAAGGGLTVAVSQAGSGKPYSHLCYSRTSAVPDCTCNAPGLTKVAGNSASVAGVSAGTTITAVGCDDGTGGTSFLPASGSAHYQSTAVMATPVITPSSSSQSDWVDVTLTNADPSKAALLCYTTDGSGPAVTAACAPGNLATLCTGSVPAGAGTVLGDLVKSSNVTVTAQACDPTQAKGLSGTSAATYLLQVAKPTLTAGSAAPGTIPIGATIGWKSATSAAPVQHFFTWDGTAPTCGGGSALQGSGIHLVNPAATTIRVVACSPGLTPSEGVAFNYSYFVQAPTVTPLNQSAQGTFDDYPVFTLSNAPSDSIVLGDHPAYHLAYSSRFCATVDGTTPACAGSTCGFGASELTPSLAGGAFYLPVHGTLKVRTCSDTGLPPSQVSSATLIGKVGPIAWSPSPAATYASPQTVQVQVAKAPTSLGATYTLCWTTGSVTIPAAPPGCAALAGYLQQQTGQAWACTSGLGLPYPTGGSESVLVGQLSATTTVSAVACKEGMPWSTDQQTYTIK
ncbi:MAG: chitobiase/beta-hexosaminidase C-terminal domain-containing protein [Polyangiaceae bacterium]|nr:chitobiase/beta-hexosaminidase C-terminal domain-containing protein [Polyangiaceae bacterium]